MKPFRASITARLLSAAAAFALIAGGLIPTLGLPTGIALPVVLLVAAGCGIVSLVLGVNDHPGQVAMLAIMMPMAFWAYALGLIVIAQKLPAFGWVLLALALVPLALLGASFVAPAAKERTA
jgi:hypothetical protein